MAGGVLGFSLTCPEMQAIPSQVGIRLRRADLQRADTCPVLLHWYSYFALTSGEVNRKAESSVISTMFSSANFSTRGSIGVAIPAARALSISHSRSLDHRRNLLNV